MSLLQIINQLVELVKKHKIITGLIVILIISLMVQANTQKNQSKNEIPVQNNQISPTPIVLPIKTEPFDITDSDPKYPLTPLLPYQGQGFIVERYIAPLTIEVKIKNSSEIPKIEPLLRDWLKGKELVVSENKITWKYSE